MTPPFTDLLRRRMAPDPPTFGLGPLPSLRRPMMVDEPDQDPDTELRQRIMQLAGAYQQAATAPQQPLPTPPAVSGLRMLGRGLASGLGQSFGEDQTGVGGFLGNFGRGFAASEGAIGAGQQQHYQQELQRAQLGQQQQDRQLGLLGSGMRTLSGLEGLGSQRAIREAQADNLRALGVSRETAAAEAARKKQQAAAMRMELIRQSPRDKGLAARLTNMSDDDVLKLGAAVTTKQLVPPTVDQTPGTWSLTPGADGSMYRVNATTGEVVPLQQPGNAPGRAGAPGAPFKKPTASGGQPTQSEQRAGGLLKLVKDADMQLDAFDQRSLAPSLGQRIPGIGNFLTTPDQRRYNNYVLQLGNAMYVLSGQNFPAAEEARFMKQYGYDPGDDPATAADKKRRRKVLVQSITDMAGRAVRPGAGGEDSESQRDWDALAAQHGAEETTRQIGPRP